MLGVRYLNLPLARCSDGLTRVTAIAILFLVCKRILLAGGQGVAVLSFASSEMVVKDGITEIPVTILRKGSSEGTASFMLQIDWVCHQVELTCSLYQRGFMLHQQTQTTVNIDLSDQMVSQTKNTVVSITLIPTGHIKSTVGDPKRIEIEVYNKEAHQRATRSTEMTGNGVVQVRLEKYYDISLRLLNGSCCHVDCKAACGNYFEICLREYNMSNSCTNWVQTDVLLTSPQTSGIGHQLNFSDDLGNGVENPLSLPFNGSWQGRLGITFRVWNNYTTPHSLVIILQFDQANVSLTKNYENILTQDLAVSKQLEFSLRAFCSSGYYGPECSVYCVPKNDVTGHYNCSTDGQKLCLSGWENPDDDCQTKTTQCNPNPCQNNGTCHDTVDSFYCNCSSGYTGSLCKTKTTQCDLNPCQNNGTCHDTVDSFYCSCSSGYTGSLCKTKTTQCNLNPCQNNGTCHNTMGSFYCSCSAHYTGSFCETKTTRCNLNPCQNNGTCHDTEDSFYCSCSNGYTGSLCKTKTTQCNPNPCQNHGTCHDADTLDGFYCSCSSGYTGSVCETSSLCHQSSCENGGSCVDRDSGFKCICLEGFTGSRCQTEIKGCLSMPCPSEASCVTKPSGGYLCVCFSQENKVISCSEVLESEADKAVSNITIALAVVCGVLGISLVILTIIIVKQRARKMARVHMTPDDSGFKNS